MPWREAYPSLDDDIDRRISHSEGRIKYWVIAGIVANLVTLIGIGAPLVYYFGQAQAQSANMVQSMLTLSQQMADQEIRLQRQELHAQMMETWAEPKGFRPPTSGYGK